MKRKYLIKKRKTGINQIENKEKKKPVKKEPVKKEPGKKETAEPEKVILTVKCPECKKTFPIEKGDDIAKIECPHCGKKGITNK